MDYTLAKELKDAGFPQGGNGEYATHGPDPLEPHSDCYFPTLEELIEACGDKLQLIVHYDTKVADEKWGAWPPQNDPDHIPEGSFGSEPKIAVARLWLALNKPHHESK